MVFRRSMYWIKIFQTQTNELILEDRIASNYFTEAFKFPLRLAQTFSYFPISIGEKDKPLQFKWLYWRISYSLLTFVLFNLELCFVVYEASRHPLTLLEIKVVVFHLGAIIQFILFFKITYEWPNFVKEWSKVECHMKSYEIMENLRLKIGIVAGTIMVFAGVEHGLVNAYKLKNKFDQDYNITEAVKNYFISTYEHIFDVVEYSIWLGVLIQFLNLQRTFYWNFTDVFIMLMGLVLTHRLKQISKKIQDVAKSKVSDIVAWKTIRKDYLRISELCHIVNERISGIIITCFLMDLYFILLQLYESLRPIENIVEKVYFFISFGLLLLRIFCMCIFGGTVFEEWKNICFYLNTISTSAYNLEIERLNNHVSTWELSLSGKNFFNISRGLILQMAGAIVTYELVLIQFYSNIP